MRPPFPLSPIAAAVLQLVREIAIVNYLRRQRAAAVRS